MSHWIKMKVDLSTNPKVVRISSALKADRLRTVGALHAVWSLFDTHSEDGKLSAYTPEILDDLIGWKGFSEAMTAVGWLSVIDNSLIMKDYEENNGTSAKKRAQDSVRKMSARKADKSPISVRQNLGPEKEKDKNITPIVPTGDSELVLLAEDSYPYPDEENHPNSGYPSDFETFWAAFPEKKGKGAAWKSFEKVQKYGALPPLAELVEIIHAQQLDRNEAKKRGEFYPEWKNPSTWLNGHCWSDGLKYPQKKERAAAESSTPDRWRELLVDQYSENYPDGLASANFPTAFHLLPASVQEEIRQAANLRTEIAEAIHATTQEAA
jgi:hypothetical protein